MNASTDTIAALATAPGRAGISIIRVSGPAAMELASLLLHRPPPPPNHAELRTVFDAGGKLLDHALVLTFKAPASYTGEDVVEFQCHGGSVTSRRILESCFSAGARLARRGEFTERAFLNGKLGYDQAEAVLDLIQAKTTRAADAALEGLAGARKRELDALYSFALDISTTIEHALDISEDELPAAFGSEVERRLAELHAAVRTAIRRRREGRLLREGACVVLAGPPNAGKSSLMNVLLSENRAIVSDIPGTTRDAIEEWLDLAGFPIRLVDTAGLRRTDDVIEAEGVRRSEELVARADLVLALDAPALSGPRVLPIHAKCDLGRGDGLNVSAKTGEGLDELKTAIVGRLEELMSFADQDEQSEAEGELAALLEVDAELSVPSVRDLVLLGNRQRSIAERLGALSGAIYSDDLLDRLFSRFCVGK